MYAIPGESNNRCIVNVKGEEKRGEFSAWSICKIERANTVSYYLNILYKLIYTVLFMRHKGNLYTTPGVLVYCITET